MKKERCSTTIQHRTEELQAIIRTRFPEADFRVSQRKEPVAGIYVETFVDPDHVDEVFDLVGDRTADISIEDGLMFIVLPRPKERAAAAGPSQPQRE